MFNPKNRFSINHNRFQPAFTDKTEQNSWRGQVIKEAGLDPSSKYFFRMFNDYYKFNRNTIEEDFSDKNIQSLKDLKDAIDEKSTDKSEASSQAEMTNLVGQGSWNAQTIKAAGLKLPSEYFIGVYTGYYRFNPDTITADFQGQSIQTLEDLKRAIDTKNSENKETAVTETVTGETDVTSKTTNKETNKQESEKTDSYSKELILSYLKNDTSVFETLIKEQAIIKNNDGTYSINPNSALRIETSGFVTAETVALGMFDAPKDMYTYEYEYAVEGADGTNGKTLRYIEDSFTVDNKSIDWENDKIFPEKCELIYEAEGKPFSLVIVTTGADGEMRKFRFDNIPWENKSDADGYDILGDFWTHSDPEPESMPNDCISHLSKTISLDSVLQVLTGCQQGNLINSSSLDDMEWTDASGKTHKLSDSKNIATGYSENAVQLKYTTTLYQNVTYDKNGVHKNDEGVQVEIRLNVDIEDKDIGKVDLSNFDEVVKYAYKQRGGQGAKNINEMLDYISHSTNADCFWNDKDGKRCHASSINSLSLIGGDYSFFGETKYIIAEDGTKYTEDMMFERICINNDYNGNPNRTYISYIKPDVSQEIVDTILNDSKNKKIMESSFGFQTLIEQNNEFEKNMSNVNESMVKLGNSKNEIIQYIIDTILDPTEYIRKFQGEIENRNILNNANIIFETLASYIVGDEQNGYELDLNKMEKSACFWDLVPALKEANYNKQMHITGKNAGLIGTALPHYDADKEYSDAFTKLCDRAGLVGNKYHNTVDMEEIEYFWEDHKYANAADLKCYIQSFYPSRIYRNDYDVYPTIGCTSKETGLASVYFISDGKLYEHGGQGVKCVQNFDEDNKEHWMKLAVYIIENYNLNFASGSNTYYDSNLIPLLYSHGIELKLNGNVLTMSADGITKQVVIPNADELYSAYPEFKSMPNNIDDLF